MKAGIDYIRQNAVDRRGGGMFTMLDLATNTWGPRREIRNPQELGYGLLGLAMYYYLTRDDEVLSDIFAIKDYIAATYYNPSLGTFQWMLQNNGSEPFDQKQLVADLDQMNTYLVLLTPILPEPQRTEWQQTLNLLARSILGTFYSPLDNLFFTTATTPWYRDLAFSGADFGHSSKALWMLRWTGLMSGDRGLVSFSEAAGRRLLDRAYLPEDGSWAQGVLAGGQIDKKRTGGSSPNSISYPAPWRWATSPRVATFRRPRITGSNISWTPNTAKSGTALTTAATRRSATIQNPGPGRARTTHSNMPWWATSPPNTCTANRRGCTTPSSPLSIGPSSIPTIFQARSIRGCHQRYRRNYPVPGRHLYGPCASRGCHPDRGLGGHLLPGALAPGSIVAAFGSRLSTDTQGPPAGEILIPQPASTVTIRDSAGVARTASQYSASPAQVNFLLPALTAPGSATLTINAKDGVISSTPIEVVPVAPGIFQLDALTGLAAANVVRVKADQSQSIEAIYQVLKGGGISALPIDLGPVTDQVYLTLWGTGMLQAKSLAVTVGGREVGVLYWGPQRRSGDANLVGVEQVNIGPLPRSLAGEGNVNIILIADGQTANPVRVAIQ